MEAQGLTQELGVVIDRNLVNHLKKKFANGPVPEEEKEKGQHQSSSLKRKKSPSKRAERLPRLFDTNNGFLLSSFTLVSLITDIV